MPADRVSVTLFTGGLEIRGDLQQLSKVSYTQGTCNIQVRLGAMHAYCPRARTICLTGPKKQAKGSKALVNASWPVLGDNSASPTGHRRTGSEQTMANLCIYQLLLKSCVSLVS